jgi:hypothetical protein
MVSPSGSRTSSTLTSALTGTVPSLVPIMAVWECSSTSPGMAVNPLPPPPERHAGAGMSEPMASIFPPPDEDGSVLQDPAGGGPDGVEVPDEEVTRGIGAGPPGKLEIPALPERQGREHS